MYPSDKFAFFQKMLQLPIYTNSLVTAMQDEFNKVYDSQNSSFTYEFTNETTEADFKQYLEDEKFWDKWITESKEAMLKQVSSVCVVDMPKDPGNDTRPYFYFQDIKAVIDIDYVQEGDNTAITMLMVKYDELTIFYVDETRYLYYTRKSADKEFPQNPTTEVFHELGYCPACFFWKESIRKAEPIVKKSMITQALANLDKLLRFENDRNCLEAYAAYPILEKFNEDCTYYEEVDNNVRYDCTEGWLQYPHMPKRCPVCEKNQLVGPGSIVTHNVPSSKDEYETIGKTKFIGADVPTLGYWTARVAEVWDEIFYDCVGQGGDTMTQAINTQQVMGNYDSKQSKCMKVVHNLEPSVNFILATFANLRYPGQFVGGHYCMGNKFYLQSVGEVLNDLSLTKKSGAPTYIVADKLDELNALNSRGNPVHKNRLWILQNLEPWPDYPINEIDLLGMQQVRPAEYLLKSEFSERILKFEREYGSIVEFGRKIDFAIKIDRIYKVLLSYGPDVIPPFIPAATRIGTTNV